MPGGVSPFQSGSDDHVVAGLVAGGATADVAEVEGVAVDEHDRVVAAPFRRPGRTTRSARRAGRPQDRIGRVAVRRDDGRVLVGEDSGLVVDLVERRLELAGVVVDRVLVHHGVVHHDRQAVDESFLGDRAGLGGSEVRDACAAACASSAASAAARVARVLIMVKGPFGAGSPLRPRPVPK